MRLRSILLVVICAFILSGTSFAAINIDNRTGTTKIFMPDGKQIIVKVDEPMPVIPDGAVVTIMAGCAVCSTTGKSVVTVSIGTYTLQVKEASKVNLCLNPDGTVNATIVAGEALITRKVEAYRNPIPPAVAEFVTTERGEKKDISPSQ